MLGHHYVQKVAARVEPVGVLPSASLPGTSRAIGPQSVPFFWASFWPSFCVYLSLCPSLSLSAGDAAQTDARRSMPGRSGAAASPRDEPHTVLGRRLAQWAQQPPCGRTHGRSNQLSWLRVAGRWLAAGWLLTGRRLLCAVWPSGRLLPAA